MNLPKTHSKSSMQALDELFGGFEELHEEPSTTTATAASVPDTTGLTDLSIKYIEGAVTSLTRRPSPKLKESFRATLDHWRKLTLVALVNTPAAQALINVVMALVETEGAFEARRLLSNVSGQVLWQASIDVQRDRRTASEAEETQSGFQDGEPDHVDADAEIPPTEDDAVNALAEAHGWLSAIADLLPIDDGDRERLGLTDGLEVCKRKEGDEWRSVYDVDQAVEIQIAKNEESLRRRNAAKILARRDAFAALARVAIAA